MKAARAGRRQYGETPRDEWRTPDRLWLPLDFEFRFDLDVAASPWNARCERFFTRRENGLAQSWEGARAWCNPPFSALPDWSAKCAVQARHCPLVVMVAPAWVDRQWWHEYIEPDRVAGYCEVRFVPFRVPFEPRYPPKKGRRRGRGFDPTAVVIWREQARRIFEPAPWLELEVAA